MSLTQHEKLLISAQLIKLHEGTLDVTQLPLIEDYIPLVTSKATHIEYSIALVKTHDEEAIYVIFPGSNDRFDWIANFRFSFREMIYKATKQVAQAASQQVTKVVAETITPLYDLYHETAFVQPHTDKPNAKTWEKQRVHSGFMSAYYGVERDIIPALERVLAEHPTLNVYGTAHSLGSAILRFTLLDAEFKGMFAQRKLPELHTFGAPRMGNSAFVKALAKRLPHITRVVHANDLVVRLPLPVFGYRHEVKQSHVGKKPFVRLYYRQDIRDHYLESYIIRLAQMTNHPHSMSQSALPDLVAQDALLQS